jgi:O-antigen/teichoic acid export membrane protein
VNLLTSTRYLRLAPFDTSSEQGRSDERYRLAVLSMAANVLSRGVSMMVMVLTVSLTIRYLGGERFGVWMTIASFVGMLTFLDLGVGNALTNKVAQVAAQINPEALRRTISGGLGFLFVLGCAIGALLYGLASVLPWDRLIKVQDLALHAEILNTVAVFSILFGFTLFTNGIQRVFAGLQRAFEAHLVSVAGSCISLFALWIATGQEAGIPYLLAATLGIQSLANLGLLLILARRNLFSVSCIASHTRTEARHLLNVGGLFFILQIGTMVGWGADSLIISSTLGAAQVAAFSIVQRLFQFVTLPMSILNAPLWGAYADAHARGEKTFIRKTLKTSLIGTSGFCLAGAAVLLLAGERLVEIWTGNAVTISLVLLAAYGGWAILDATGTALAMFLNGCGIVKPQVFTVIVFVIFSLPAKLFLISNFGLEAMITGQALIYLLITSVSYGAIFRKKLLENCL